MTTRIRIRRENNGPDRTPDIRPALRDALNMNRQVSCWMMKTSDIREYQLYLCRDSIESIREVEAKRCDVTVFNDHGDFQGEAGVLFLPSDDEKDLPARIAAAVETAKEANSSPFDMAEPIAAGYASPEIVDSEIIAEPFEAARSLAVRLIDAVSAEENVTLAAGEFFAEIADVKFENSNDVFVEARATKVNIEAVLTAKLNGDEAERAFTVTRRRAADVNMEKLVADNAQWARDACRASTPPSGSFDIVIRGSALPQFLSPLTLHSSAQAKFMNLTGWELGKSILPEDQVRGDKITLTSDPVLDFGVESFPFDDYGCARKTIRILENGVFTEYIAQKPFADWTDTPITGPFSNMVVACGATPAEDFYAAKPFLEIVAFSSIAPDVVSGDFATEIRLGYLHEENGITPVRGGSVSGNILEALKNVRLSRETRFFGNYHGPARIKFSSLSVSGS